MLGLVRFGSYPGAVELEKTPARWRAYLRDAIIEPAIGRDMLALGTVRKPALLRQVFAVAAGSPAQIISLQKMQGQLQDSGALETVAHYLALLQDAYLIASLKSMRPKPTDGAGATQARDVEQWSSFGYAPRRRAGSGARTSAFRSMG